MCKLPDGRGWQWEKLGLALVGRALLSKALKSNYFLMGGVVLSPWYYFWPVANQSLGLWAPW